jgi:hypothetical protein
MVLKLEKKCNTSRHRGNPNPINNLEIRKSLDISRSLISRYSLTKFKRIPAFPESRNCEKSCAHAAAEFA